MSALAYYISLPFLYLISLLPFWLLYRVSDFFFVLLYYVFGYRKKIVMQNLRNSFPEKSEEELKKISRKFYRYLCDLMLETFKLFTISQKTLHKRCVITQGADALFTHYYQKKQSIITVMGHLGNWEWANCTFEHDKHQLYGIYHQLSNKHFDGLMLKVRTRFGSVFVEMRNTLREMITHKNDLTNTTFISDQTPPPENAYWTTFLNQDTPVFVGVEKIAKKFNYPVLYIGVKRVKRGYYQVFAETLFENPKDTADGEISEAHTRRLEKDIIQQPEIWLWSHRRWKHKRNKN